MLHAHVELFTIGVYGKSEQQFFHELSKARIDTFCDIRRRRGMRGSLYAFANSRLLQLKLASLGIKYRHFLRLSPSDAARRTQKLQDKTAGVGKRSRMELSEEFKALYKEECLKQFSSDQLLADLGPDAQRIAFFCVESDHRACHRSLLANRIASDLGIRVTNL